MSAPETFSTAADIIDKIGVTALSQGLGHKNPSTVHSWKTRGSIPVVHWNNVIRVARQRNVEGISFGTLALVSGIEVGGEQ